MSTALLRRAAAGCIVVVAWALGAAPGRCQPPKPDPAIDPLETRVKAFLEGISAGETTSAYNTLLRGSQLAKQTDAVKTLMDKTNELKSKYGEFRKFERIAARRVGDDLVMFKYLYKCEDFPVVWYFTFYRTPSRSDVALTDSSAWRVIIVRLDTDLESLAW